MHWPKYFTDLLPAPFPFAPVPRCLLNPRFGPGTSTFVMEELGKAGVPRRIAKGSLSWIEGLSEAFETSWPRFVPGHEAIEKLAPPEIPLPPLKRRKH